MSKLNITEVLNDRFKCPECDAAGSWRSHATNSRMNSLIDRLVCRRCGEAIVVKIPRLVGSTEGRREQAEKEYKTLSRLQTVFPQDEHYSTLLPLAYLDCGGYGAVITRQVGGDNLERYARKLKATRLQGAFRPAGVLLRRLHDSCPDGYQLNVLGVEEKITYLRETYSAALHADQRVRVVWEKFEKEAAEVASLALRSTWGHGDFKPGNILCDGHKYVMIDVQLDYRGAFVYDIASFLDHVQLAGLGIGGRRLRHFYQRAEDEFLNGYGSISSDGELHALRWAQLYFMLVYFGRYRQQGPLSAIYANWNVRPLVENLAAQI